MAGYMYLGSQRVCPVVISGGSPEPTEFFTIKFPDNVVNFDGRIYGKSFYIRNGSGQNQPVFFDFNKVETISSSSALDSVFYNVICPIGINVSSIKKVTGTQSFSTCFGYVNFIDGYKDIYFDNLEEISGVYGMANSFSYGNVTSIHFPKLVVLANSCLMRCGSVNGLNMYFNSLKTTSFPNGNELVDVAYGVTNKVLHFPSNMASVVPTLSGYPNFGGTDTTILYDLEPTEN